MLLRKALQLGMCSALLASVGAVCYAFFFNKQFDYSADLGYVTIIGTCIFISITASLVFWVLLTAASKWGELVFNLVFAIGTFASLQVPIGAKVLSEFPEFYPIFAIPLHFCPILAWMILRVLFFPVRMSTAFDKQTEDGI